MASKYLNKYPVPTNFEEILHDLTKQILQDQPQDIVAFSAKYFECLANNTKFVYDAAVNDQVYVPKKIVNQRELKPEESKSSIKTQNTENFIADQASQFTNNLFSNQIDQVNTSIIKKLQDLDVQETQQNQIDDIDDQIDNMKLQLQAQILAENKQLNEIEQQNVEEEQTEAQVEQQEAQVEQQEVDQQEEQQFGDEQVQQDEQEQQEEQQANEEQQDAEEQQAVEEQEQQAEQQNEQQE